MHTTIETISSGKYSQGRDRLIERTKAMLERLPDTARGIIRQAIIYHDPRRGEARLCVVGCPVGVPEHEITVGQQQILTPSIFKGNRFINDFLKELSRETERAAEYLAQYRIKKDAQAAA